MAWKDNLFFNAEADGHHLELNAKSPLGTGKAPTPQELLVLNDREIGRGEAAFQ